MATKVEVLNNQTIWDLAITEYGSLEGGLHLMQDNNGSVNFDNNAVAGTILEVKNSVIDKDVSGFFSAREIKPATAKPYNLVKGDFGLDFSNDFN